MWPNVAVEKLFRNLAPVICNQQQELLAAVKDAGDPGRDAQPMAEGTGA